MSMYEVLGDNHQLFVAGIKIDISGGISYYYFIIMKYWLIFLNINQHYYVYL